MELLHVGSVESGFLSQLAPCSFLCCLIDVHETAWKSPPSFVGLKAPLDKQHFQAGAVESENHTVGGDGGMRVFIPIATHDFHSGVLSCNHTQVDVGLPEHVPQVGMHSFWSHDRNCFGVNFTQSYGFLLEYESKTKKTSLL